MTRRLSIGLLALLPFLAAACARDLRTDLALVDVSTGWADDGPVEGVMNKLVPTISFRIRNVSRSDIDRVQLSVVFRRGGESQSWGERFVQGIGADGLAAGATTDLLVLRSPRGYTGSQGPDEMLRNAEFVDARVDVFGRHTNRWIKLGEFQIDRILVSQ